MISLENELDIQFYELIHYLVTGQSDEILGDEKQHHQLFHTARTCRVAPCLSSGPIPKVDAFHEVSCYDLTQNGLRYFAEERPGQQHIVIELSKIEGRLLVESEIERVDRVVVLPSGSLRYLQPDENHENDNPEIMLRYLVGCRFIKRLGKRSKMESDETLATADRTTAPA